jgi:hypothetical protein
VRAGELFFFFNFWSNEMSVKYIFDTDGRPELHMAIAARLQELGFNNTEQMSIHHARNITVGFYNDNEIHYGSAEVDNDMFAHMQRKTLDDLYDHEERQYSITIDGKTVLISEESFRALKKSLL